METKKHGGARKGAGRKKKTNEKLVEAVFEQPKKVRKPRTTRVEKDLELAKHFIAAGTKKARKPKAISIEKSNDPELDKMFSELDAALDTTMDREINYTNYLRTVSKVLDFCLILGFGLMLVLLVATLYFAILRF